MQRRRGEKDQSTLCLQLILHLLKTNPWPLSSLMQNALKQIQYLICSRTSLQNDVQENRKKGNHPFLEVKNLNR